MKKKKESCLRHFQVHICLCFSSCHLHSLSLVHPLRFCPLFPPVCHIFSPLLLTHCLVFLSSPGIRNSVCIRKISSYALSYVLCLSSPSLRASVSFSALSISSILLHSSQLLLRLPLALLFSLSLSLASLLFCFLSFSTFYSMTNCRARFCYSHVFLNVP